jgi:hypothetical protein
MTYWAGLYKKDLQEKLLDGVIGVKVLLSCAAALKKYWLNEQGCLCRLCCLQSRKIGRAIRCEVDLEMWIKTI